MNINNLWLSSDGRYVFNSDDPRYHPFNRPYTVNPDDEFMMEIVKKHLLAHPDALQPEPLSPPPTDAQLEASAEAQRKARFSEYDIAIMLLKRAERMGDSTATASIARWDEYAVALQALNDRAGWFRETVWPTKPEV